MEGSLLLAKHQTIGLLRSLATLRHKILRLGPIEIYLVSLTAHCLKIFPLVILKGIERKILVECK